MNFTFEKLRILTKSSRPTKSLLLDCTLIHSYKLKKRKAQVSFVVSHKVVVAAAARRPRRRQSMPRAIITLAAGLARETEGTGSSLNRGPHALWRDREREREWEREREGREREGTETWQCLHRSTWWWSCSRRERERECRCFLLNTYSLPVVSFN